MKANTRHSRRLKVGLARPRLHVRSTLTDFSYASIDLRTQRRLGTGYELGHICGKYYTKENIPEEVELVNDLWNLIGVYRELKALVGTGDITNLVSRSQEMVSTEEEADDARYQREVEKAQPSPEISGPQPRPEQVGIKGQEKWKTKPGKAKTAIISAHYQCEVNPTHKTFVSRVTNENYVEAHHLIPMAFQGQFSNSLDVQSNIIALCPNCHRLLHHAQSNEIRNVIELLYEKRKGLLQQSGTVIDLEKLLEFYQ